MRRTRIARARGGYYATLGVMGAQVAPAPGDPTPPPQPPSPEELQRLQYERDSAAAEAARIKKELDEIKKALPSDEQRAKWAELEDAHRKAEEERLAKAGEFESWRQQITERFQRDIDTVRQDTANERAAREKLERELEDTLIGREFADAVGLFGPSGKTVLLPTIAQAYFKSHVVVEGVPNAAGVPVRRVVVKDDRGATIVDPKSGQPLPFAQAMEELINKHPNRDHMLRGSMKVGSGTSGGLTDGSGKLDTSRLKAGDFQDPSVRDAVRKQQSSAGGLQFGPGFDRINSMKRNK